MALRQHELVLTPGRKPTLPVVTVELYIKWYGLYVVYPDGVVKAENFPDEGDYSEIGSPYLDHAPNPRHVVRWAERMGYAIDDLALELMHGRYEMEARNNHPDDALRDPETSHSRYIALQNARAEGYRDGIEAALKVVKEMQSDSMQMSSDPFANAVDQAVDYIQALLPT